MNNVSIAAADAKALGGIELNLSIDVSSAIMALSGAIVDAMSEVNSIVGV